MRLLRTYYRIWDILKHFSSFDQVCYLSGIKSEQIKGDLLLIPFFIKWSITSTVKPVKTKNRKVHEGKKKINSRQVYALAGT